MGRLIQKLSKLYSIGQVSILHEHQEGILDNEGHEFRERPFLRARMPIHRDCLHKMADFQHLKKSQQLGTVLQIEYTCIRGGPDLNYSRQSLFTVSNAHCTAQFEKLLGRKYISNHSISFALIHAAMRSTSNDSSSVLEREELLKSEKLPFPFSYLASMLKKSKTFE